MSGLRGVPAGRGVLMQAGWHDRRPADDDASHYLFACAGGHYWDATPPSR
jgi:hypothetical protein